jgi:hypothetical protein
MTSVGAIALVLVFPARSVSVITLLLPSSNHPVDVALQPTVPLAVAGLGEHTIQGTLSVIPDSTHVRERVIVSPDCAGFGTMLATTGVIGFVLSTVSPVVDPVLVFHAESVTVTVVSAPSNNPTPTVPLQLTLPLAVAGLGEQVIHVTVTVAPASTPEIMVVISVPLFAGFGEIESTVGAAGALSSITSIGDSALVLVFPASSVSVIVLLLPSSNHPVDVALQSTVPLAATGSGEHAIHGTVTLVPTSTDVNARVIVTPDCAGFGVIFPTTGVVGSVVSMLPVSMMLELVFQAVSVSSTTTGHTDGIRLGVMPNMPAPSTTHVPIITPVELKIVTLVPISPVPCIGEKFVGRVKSELTGAITSISPHERVPPVLVFPEGSVVVIVTGPQLGIGLGVILKVPLPLTVHVPIMAQVEL